MEDVRRLKSAQARRQVTLGQKVERPQQQRGLGDIVVPCNEAEDALPSGLTTIVIRSPDSVLGEH